MKFHFRGGFSILDLYEASLYRRIISVQQLARSLGTHKQTENGLLSCMDYMPSKDFDPGIVRELG